MLTSHRSEILHSLIFFFFRTKMKIDFHSVEFLNRTICSHSVAPHQPGHINTSSSDTVLLYEDQSQTPRIVRWLNCFVAPPTPVTGTDVTYTHHALIWDMCCVKHAEKELLTMTRANNGLVAFSTQRGHQAGWTVKGKLTGMAMDMSVWGITSDGHGHLFVCDINNSCVQMFSTSGRYMGTVLREGDQGLAQPWLIRWCETTSSLVVVHIKNREYQVSVIKVTIEDQSPEVVSPAQETPAVVSTPASVAVPMEVQQTTIAPPPPPPPLSATPAAPERPLSIDDFRCRGNVTLRLKGYTNRRVLYFIFAVKFLCFNQTSCKHIHCTVHSQINLFIVKI